MEIIINKFTLSDLEIIKDELEKSFDDFWNYNILKQEIIKEDYSYIVAKNLKGEVIGFAGVQFILDEANITNIVTKKQFRNCGIGTMLLKELINISKQRECKNIILEVNENNSIALKLYKNMGFIEIGQRKKYYNGKDTAIIMKLNQ